MDTRRFDHGLRSDRSWHFQNSEESGRRLDWYGYAPNETHFSSLRAQLNGSFCASLSLFIDKWLVLCAIGPARFGKTRPFPASGEIWKEIWREALSKTSCSTFLLSSSRTARRTCKSSRISLAKELIVTCGKGRLADAPTNDVAFTLVGPHTPLDPDTFGQPLNWEQFLDMRVYSP